MSLFGTRIVRGTGVPLTIASPSPEEAAASLDLKRKEEEEARLKALINARINLPPREQIVLCLKDAGLTPDVDFILARTCCLDTELRGGDLRQSWRQVSYGRVIGISILRGHILELTLSFAPHDFLPEERTIRFDCFEKSGWYARFYKLDLRWEKTMKSLNFYLVQKGE